MLVSELVDRLRELPPDKAVLCQVVAGEDVWNMEYNISDVPASRMAVLTVSHPQLTSLPTPNDNIDDLCRRMFMYAFTGAGGKTDQMRAYDVKRALAVFFTDEEIERAGRSICAS